MIQVQSQQMTLYIIMTVQTLFPHICYIGNSGAGDIKLAYFFACTFLINLHDCFLENL